MRIIKIKLLKIKCLFISRLRFEGVTNNLVNDCLKPIDIVLEKAKLQADDIKLVFMFLENLFFFEYFFCFRLFFVVVVQKFLNYAMLFKIN